MVLHHLSLVCSDKSSDLYRVGKMTSQEVSIEVEETLREDLIKTAINFLSNPNVRNSPRVQKEAFLKKKGLTSEEIKVAFEESNRASNVVPYKNNSELQYSAQTTLAPLSGFQKFKDILNTIALLIGASYGLYYLYKKFISRFLFGDPKKPKSDESLMNDISETVKKSISGLRDDVNQVHAELEKVLTSQTEQQSYIKEISQLKFEVATVKGILLSRHQFPSVSLSTTSIPAWQLTSSRHKNDKEILEGEDVEHNSGSSEAEIGQGANRNGGSQGSDSSLEMIKEVDG